MSARTGLPTLLLVAALGLSCGQPLDSTAADGTKNAPPAPAEDFHTRVIETPAIGIVSGGTTSTHPCERTYFQLFNEDAALAPLGILVQECSGCHGEGGNAHPGFTDILDTASLIDPARVSTGTTKGRRLVIPGDPEGSLLYQRMFEGAMPPSLPGVRVDPEPDNVPATIAETSLVHEWILHCLGATEPSRPPEGTGGQGGVGGSEGEGDGQNGAGGARGGTGPEDGSGAAGAPGVAARGGNAGALGGGGRGGAAAPGGGAGGRGAGGRRGGLGGNAGGAM